MSPHRKLHCTIIVALCSAAAGVAWGEPDPPTPAPQPEWILDEERSNEAEDRSWEAEQEFNRNPTDANRDAKESREYEARLREDACRQSEKRRPVVP